MNELNVVQGASCKGQDFTDFFLSDSPQSVIKDATKCRLSNM